MDKIEEGDTVEIEPPAQEEQPKSRESKEKMNSTNQEMYETAKGELLPSNTQDSAFKSNKSKITNRDLTSPNFDKDKQIAASPT